MANLRVISIGAMSAHPLWGERAAVRTGHATTSLIISREARILVDPGLPVAALTSRLLERANLKPSDITHDSSRAFTLIAGVDWRRSMARYG